MTETHIIILLTLGPLCWMIGGTGYKWVRRFVWPIIAGVAMLAGGLSILLAGLVAITIAVTAALPYGDRTPWPAKMLVFASLGLPGLVINLASWWLMLVQMVGLTLLMLASRKWNFVTWKIWEGASGFLQAAVIVMAVLI